MDFRTDIRMPPLLTNPDGNERRVGVELEFAAISAQEGARLVQSLFGGMIVEEDPHRYHITGTELGPFTCELDTQYAHRAYDEPDAIPPDIDPLGMLLAAFQDEMRSIFGDISSLIVPCEVVCPPIPLSDLPRLEKLVKTLTEAGAEGTQFSPFYAFGAQLNPEIATEDPAWLTSILKSYLLLSEWLRAIMEIDPTRRLVAFADPFPPNYTSKVVNPGYSPNLEQLMDDYLFFNPTRNREMDLLPLFVWFDAKRVHKAIADPRIKARPTFHYRLPDANLGVPGWSLTLEWNRWQIVEELASKRDVLDAMGVAYQENRDRILRENWAIKASEWLVLS